MDGFRMDKIKRIKLEGLVYGIALGFAIASFLYAMMML